MLVVLSLNNLATRVRAFGGWVPKPKRCSMLAWCVPSTTRPDELMPPHSANANLSRGSTWLSFECSRARGGGGRIISPRKSETGISECLFVDPCAPRA